MKQVDHNSSHTASRKLVRVLTLLTLASQQLSSLSHRATDRHHRKVFYCLSTALSEYSRPLADLIQRGGEL
jgi:hypothetical protein